jgi:predicted nucleotidyltransferase
MSLSKASRGEEVLAILRRNDVKRAAFFGSIVRGEMTDESDVDILVEFEGRKSLMDLSGLKIAALGGDRPGSGRPNLRLPPPPAERENP